MTTILVVDDQPDKRAFLVTLLNYHGYRLREASDGAEALAMARGEPPDLIISDLLLPTMDGFEFVRHLRTDPALAATRVIFSTAHYHEREASALAREWDVAAILYTPWEPTTLLQTVEALLCHNEAPVPTLRPARCEGEPRQMLRDEIAHKAEQLQRVNHKLSALLEFSPRLVTEYNPRRVLEAYCHAARDIIGAQYTAVGVVEGRAATLQHFFLCGVDAATAARLRAAWPAEPIQGTLLPERRPYRLHYAVGEPQPLALPLPLPPAHAFLCVPLTLQAQTSGWLCLANKVGAAAFDAEDEGLAVMLAAQLAVAYENAQGYATIQRYATQLHEEIAEHQHAKAALQDSAHQLRALSRRLVEVQEQERRAMARELHDEIGQLLTGVKLSLGLGRHLPVDVVQTGLAYARGLVQELIAKVRSLSLALRPTMLDDFGLLPALLWQVERYTAQSHVRVLVEHHGLDRRFAPEMETAAYRIVQEALTNIARHAGVSEASVHVWTHQETLIVQITDRGQGFDPDALSLGRYTGGVTGMRERAMLLGGQLLVESAPGAGTTICAELPLHPPPQEDHHPSIDSPGSIVYANPCAC